MLPRYVRVSFHGSESTESIEFLLSGNLKQAFSRNFADNFRPNLGQVIVIIKDRLGFGLKTVQLREFVAKGSFQVSFHVIDALQKAPPSTPWLT
jgi:hypothetical protein